MKDGNFRIESIPMKQRFQLKLSTILYKKFKNDEPTLNPIYPQKKKNKKYGILSSGFIIHYKNVN